MESVLIWLILPHDRLGKLSVFNSKVNGKPARCGWLVIATATAVSERSLKTSWLKINTGRKPARSKVKS